MRMAETRKPDIYFRENGQIDITSRVSKTLGLHPGDAINVWNAGGEYYLYVAERNVKGKFRGVCRKVNFEAISSVPISTTWQRKSSFCAERGRLTCPWVPQLRWTTLGQLCR